MNGRKVGLLTAAAAMALPAAGLAARTIKPQDGSYKGTPHYKVSGKAQTAQLTITVKHGKITGASIQAQKLPLDAKHSHGYACGDVNIASTQGEKPSGTVAASGQFNYTFKSTNKNFPDRWTLVGKFTSATAGQGTIRDVYDVKVAKSHCDSGKVSFTVKKA